MVATAATFDLAIGVPGGMTLPIAGLTMVTVRPTHRRRGLLRQLLLRQRAVFTENLPAGKIEVIELIANDVRAEATLWRLALGIDLFPGRHRGIAPWCPEIF